MIFTIIAPLALNISDISCCMTFCSDFLYGFLSLILFAPSFSFNGLSVLRIITQEVRLRLGSCYSVGVIGVPIFEVPG